MRTWLVLDVDYLAHRAIYSTGTLVYDKVYTGVLFGIYRDIANLQSLFGTQDFAFCFDHGQPLRLKVWPHYKIHRRNSPMDQQRAAMLKALPQQLNDLKDGQLEEMGFLNVFFQEGYEADDIIASVVENLGTDERAIIVSADSDLFQLLKQDKISIYKPREKVHITEETFRKQWGIRPEHWIDVKSISGCATDNVPGVDRVKELTAARYLRKELKTESVAYKSIKAWVGSDEWLLSRKLVKLPYPGLALFKAQPHPPITDKAWDKTMKKLGIQVLRRDSQYMRSKMEINAP